MMNITTVIKARVLHGNLQHKALSVSTITVVQSHLETLDALMKGSQNVGQSRTGHIKVNEVMLRADALELVLIEEILGEQLTT